MHSLIDEKIVDTIRSTGNATENLPDRIEVMEAHRLAYDRVAENVIITGCQIMGSMPGVLKKLGRIFDRGNLSYTFLSKEYCCGNTLYRPAIKARDEAAMAECRKLSREFLQLNIDKAAALNACRLIIFCSPCYPIYKHAFPTVDIIYYPQAINEAIQPMKWNQEIDYYAGCYKLHQKFAPVPMDLKSTNSVFNKIEGLSINRIGAPQCCYHPQGLNHMLDHVQTKRMVHICTGCYFQAVLNMPKERQVQIWMLPEFIDRLQTGNAG